MLFHMLFHHDDNNTGGGKWKDVNENKEACCCDVSYSTNRVVGRVLLSGASVLA